MLDATKAWLSAVEISKACGVSARSIRRRGIKEGWRVRSQKRRGGSPQLLFLAEDVFKSLGTAVESRFIVPSNGQPADEKDARASAPRTLANLTDAARATVAANKKDLDDWRAYVREHAGRAGKEVLTREWIEQRNARDPDNPVKRSTLYRRDKAEREDGVVGLADGRQLSRSNTRRKDLPEPLWAAFHGLYLDQKKLSVQLCYETALGKFPEHDRRQWAEEFPVDLFRRRVRELPERVLVYFREGKKAYYDRCETPIRRDRRSLLSNELWCSDHHELDLMVLHPQTGRFVRPWFTVWQDVRSNKIMGWALELSAPHQHRVMLTFADGVLQFGLPGNILIDNGKDYACKAFAGGRRRRAACAVNEKELNPILAELEVIPHYAIPYNARSKPTERFFRTLEDRFVKLFPTYCGNKPEKKPDYLKQRLQDGDNVPMLDEVREALGKWLNWFCAEFRQHADGMDEMPPDQAFQAHLHTTRMVSENRLKMLLMPSDLLDVYRGCVRLTVAGVSRFYSDEAGLLAQFPAASQVRVRFNPSSLKRVFLFDERNEFLCTAVEQSPVAWFDSDALRDAKSRQNRLRRDVRRGLDAQHEIMTQPRDALAALEQVERGNAALAATRELRSTGTDNQKALPPARATRREKLGAFPLTDAFRVVNGPDEPDSTTRNPLIDEFLDAPPREQPSDGESDLSTDRWVDEILNAPPREQPSDEGGEDWGEEFLLDGPARESQPRRGN